MLDSAEDAVKQPDSVVDAADDANQTGGSPDVKIDDQAERAAPVSNEGTLVSAESLSAAYRALGHAALSVVPGNLGEEPIL